VAFQIGRNAAQPVTPIPPSAQWGAVQLSSGHGAAVVKRTADTQPTMPLAADNAPYVSRLVKLTNCRWDATRTTADLSSGSQLQPGQSLHLLEGIAEINSSFHSGVVESFQLEGPVGLMMASQGVPSLLYGKLSAKVNRNNDVFSLDTPLGRVSVAAEASIGVSASANEVELHVFSGSAVFDPLPMFRGANADRRLNVFAGASVRVTSSSDGNIGVDHGDANEEAFVTQASMIASQLNISDNYVAAIKKAKPIAYWRFDRVQDGYVPNEMGDQFACRIEGPVRWRTYPAGNRSVEFGFATQPALLLTDDCVDTALAGGFSVELWAKPSYFQTGTILSFARIAADNVEVPPQGMLIELLGPATDAGAVLRSRIRFLHRDPPGRDVRTGVSCFSDQPYVPRKWQHVTAVKDAGAMRLFVDGKLAAKAQDTASTAEDLRILMGQLYSFTTGPNAGVRPFVGELAEVAIYDKALSVDEIAKHIKLAHEGVHPREAFFQ
jgi:concanavalin A-like lectin/glucanase superfamily protein